MCDCYHEGTCWGTREKDSCTCGGDRAKCDFYPSITKSEEYVNHPSHYNRGTIEVWNFVSDWGLNFDRGSAIKYICRAGAKDTSKEIQDLMKAIEFLKHEIRMLEVKKNAEG